PAGHRVDRVPRRRRLLGAADGLLPPPHRPRSLPPPVPRARVSAKGDRADWNRRHSTAERAHASTAPSPFFVDEVAGLAPGRALDLACGAGRNAVWLAERGWRVTAVDFSEVALGMARALATARGVAVEWIEADVATWTPPARSFDLVSVLYLQLPAAQRRLALAHAAGPGRPPRPPVPHP